MSNKNQLKTELKNLITIQIDKVGQGYPFYSLYKPIIYEQINKIIEYIVEEEDFLKNLYEILKAYFEKK
jgi:hypothetical protein